ncbi:MAG: AMP-binding protein [Proteobacteria bacterium]|nr:AMP-binding protein [Pseudomonadota bacterium]
MSENRFIFDAVRDYAETRGDHAALIFGDRVTSYGDLELRANRVASGLSSLGLGPQSRIAILTGNNDYFFEIWLGAALGNFVLTPINARLAAPDVVSSVASTRTGSGFSRYLSAIRNPIPATRIPITMKSVFRPDIRRVLCSSGTSLVFLTPSGVTSYAQAKIRAIGKPIKSRKITKVVTQPGKRSAGIAMSVICASNHATMR